MMMMMDGWSWQNNARLGGGVGTDPVMSNIDRDGPRSLSLILFRMLLQCAQSRVYRCRVVIIILVRVRGEEVNAAQLVLSRSSTLWRTSSSSFVACGVGQSRRVVCWVCCWCCCLVYDVVGARSLVRLSGVRKGGRTDGSRCFASTWSQRRHKKSTYSTDRH